MRGYLLLPLLLVAVAYATKDPAAPHHHRTTSSATTTTTSRHSPPSKTAGKRRLVRGGGGHKLRRDEEEALLRGEHLLHVRPRNVTSLNIRKDRKSARIAKKKSPTETTKIHGLKKSSKSSALGQKNDRKEMKRKDMKKKELKKKEHSKTRQRVNIKKYDPKKHGLKKNIHKDKLSVKKRLEQAKEKKKALEKITGLVSKTRKRRQGRTNRRQGHN